MIVHDRRPRNDTSRPSDDREDTASLAILQAALEIGREDRNWLGVRLSQGEVEQADLRQEVDRLNEALRGRETAISALSEQTAASTTLTGQLTRQVSVLWEERDRLLRFLQDASAERERLLGSLDDATRVAEAATTGIVDAVRERDALAAELEQFRAAGAAHPAASETTPANLEIAPSDVVELARSVELISEAIGEVRRLARESRGVAARNSAASASIITDAVDACMREPLAGFSGLQTEVRRIGARIDQVAAGLAQVATSRSNGTGQRLERANITRLHMAPGLIGDASRQTPASQLVQAPHAGRTRPLLTLPAVERALARALPVIGLPRTVVSPLLSAWLAGAMPVISGPDALTALRMCGRVLAADRIAVVRVGSGFSDPKDLFGKSAHREGQDGADRSALLDLLHDAVTAGGREGLSLVVFEGVNRASVERVLLPLLQHIANQDNTTDDRALGRLMPDDLATDARYTAIANAPWPSNVLVAATIAGEERTQPLPSALWARAAYLCLDHVPAPMLGRSAIDNSGSHQARAARVSFVPTELWDGWTAETRDEADITACVSGDIEILDSRRDVVATWRMIEAALAVIGRCHPVERTASVLLHHAVVPWAVSVGLDREAAQLVQSNAPGGATEPTPRACCACLERAIRGSNNQ